MDILVSAIITTHNRKEQVIKAIESVIRQTYGKIELIVVDDASDKESSDYLRKLASKKGYKYIYISSDESKGGNHARNVGIAVSSGEYIAFLDDDDQWMPEKTKKQVDCLNNNPECGLVYCGRVFKKGNRILDRTNFKYAFDGDCSKKIFTRIIFVTSMIMIRRSLLNKIGLFDEGLRFWQEYELGIRACQETKIGLVRDYLVHYGVYPGDANKLTNKLDGWIDAVNYIKSKHESLISDLSPEDNREFEIVILRDAVGRAYACGDKKRMRVFLKRLYRIDHNWKNGLKYIINTPTLAFWKR